MPQGGVGRPGGPVYPGAPHPGGRPPARPAKRRLIDYPRANRTGFLRWIPSWKLFATTALTMAVVMIVGLLAAYAATDVPPIQPISEAQTTRVLYSDKSLMTTFAQQNRTIVPIDKISKDMQIATIAAEDRTFYANRGISPIGIVRAAWNNARGRDLQGGSTITQQYVKNTRIESSRTWRRKIKEFFISIKINNELSKDDILANYLNSIYFGRNTYGIEAAAQSYFGPKTHAQDLNLWQSAYLAGIINGPELYDVSDKDDKEALELAQARFHHVLDGLVELGRITQAQADSVNFTTEVVIKVQPVKQRVSREDDQTIYLEQMVKAEMATICAQHLENCKTFADVSRGGYVIQTTFDRKLIAEAVKAVHDKDIGTGKRSTWPARTQVGLVSLDPRTGAVRAIYGGDGRSRFISAATQDRPAAGSIYKPFTLLAALEGTSKNGSDGIGLHSRFSGRSPFRYDSNLVGAGSSNKVTNFGGEQFGMVDLVTATEHSVNTVYAQLNQELGSGSRTRDALLRAVGPQPKETQKKIITGEISNTLGNGTPTAEEMASAYGTIAAQGMNHPAFVVQSVTNSRGGVEYAHDDSKADQVFSKDVTADATYALQKVVRNGTGEYASRLGRPAAGKTGTVGSNGRETMAAWFVGFTPQLSTAVVIHRLAKNGRDREVVRSWGQLGDRPMQGGMFPVRIWTSFMKQALEGQEVMDFPEPAWVGETLNPAPPEPTESPSPSASPSPSDGQNAGDQNGNGQNNGNNGNGQNNGNGNGQNPNPTDSGGQDNGNNGNNGNGQDNGGQPTAGSTS